MAGAFLAGLAGDAITSGVGSLINAGANAINQKVEYDFNKQLQLASFKHDKEMLQSQVLATKHKARGLVRWRLFPYRCRERCCERADDKNFGLEWNKVLCPK